MTGYLKLWVVELFVAGVCLLSLAALSLVFGFSLYFEDKDLRDRGLTAEANITDRMRVDDGILVEYFFADLDGRTIKTRKVLTGKWVDLVDQRPLLPIVYIDKNPGRHVIGTPSDLSRQNWLSWPAMIAGFLLIGAAVYLIFRVLARARSAASLIQNGVVVIGEVRRLISPPGMNKKPQIVSYHFAAKNGRWYEGQSPKLPAHLIKRWPVGTKINVAYEPGNPSKNVPDVLCLKGKPQLPEAEPVVDPVAPQPE